MMELAHDGMEMDLCIARSGHRVMKDRLTRTHNYLGAGRGAAPAQDRDSGRTAQLVLSWHLLSLPLCSRGGVSEIE